LDAIGGYVSLSPGHHIDFGAAITSILGMPIDDLTLRNAKNRNIEKSKSTRLKLTQTKDSVRRGKWTVEEQAYASRLIEIFEAGVAPIENGSTLRSYLSERLNCAPMRISKKYTGDKCVGKVDFKIE
jgi:hypothetical protein